jgi:hypothetical protein
VIPLRQKGQLPARASTGTAAVRLAVGMAALTLAAAGCTGQVAVSPPPPPAPQAARACAALAQALPAELDPIGARRKVTPASQLTAAWGDPPAALRCGVDRPRALTATATLVTVNGVDWFAEELTQGSLMTTVGRVANVELTVPRDAGPAPSMAAGLSDVIKASIPLITQR